MSGAVWWECKGQSIRRLGHHKVPYSLIHRLGRYKLVVVKR